LRAVRCYAFAVVALAATGCARAGNPNEGPGDSAPPIDAPVVIDAANTKVDARPIDARPIDAAPDAPPDAAVATCQSAATCATATVLPQIGGDETGASTSSATGFQSAWISIRLKETDNSAFADPMSMRATLTSPATAMFDLQVYLPGDATSTDCTTPTPTVTTSGVTETWAHEWGETGTFANGVDDSRTIILEISPRSPDGCAPADTWSLSIQTGID
jgi:hypothetical protein